MTVGTWKVNSIVLCLLVVVLQHASVDANPLAKFLMMNSRKDMQAGAPVSPPTPSSNASPESDATDKDCIPSQELESVQGQLSSAQEAAAVAAREQAEANALASKLQEEHEGYKKETESRLENLSKSNENAHKIARVQEDFAARIAKMQQQAAADLAEAKATIDEKEKEIELLKENNLRHVSNTEAEWKSELQNAESAKAEIVIQIQSEYEERLKELEEQTAILTGEKKALQENYDRIGGKYENLIKNQEIALQAYLEVNLDREIAKATKLARASLETELEELKNTSVITIDQLTAELESLKESSAASIKKWEDDYTTLKNESEQKIKKLTDDYKSLQVSNKKFVDDLKKSHKEAMDNLKSQQESNWEASHRDAMTALKDKLNTFENDNGVLVQTIESTKQELAESKATCKRATQDAEYWERHFETRSYVNFTHVAEGVGALPVYDSFVAPHVDVAKTVVGDTAKTAFDGMAQQFEAKCPFALTALRKFEETTGLSLPKTFFSKTEYSCRHADESVTFFLKILLFFVLFLMRRRVLHLVQPLWNVACEATEYAIINPVKSMTAGGKVKGSGGGYISGTGGTPPKKPTQKR